MKKIITMLLILALCAGQCACGGGEKIELPTQPAQIALPDRPATGETQTAEPGETSESTEPTGKTYPWEAEFREEDFDKISYTAPNNDQIISWRDGGLFGITRREIYEWAETGIIEDSYYYPSGNASHCYRWHPDGSYEEYHYLDNGYTDQETLIVHLGTMIYAKHISADGSFSENKYAEDGTPTYCVVSSADGSYSEYTYAADGIPTYCITTYPDGSYTEEKYNEQGIPCYYKSLSPDGSYSELQYYDNGSLKSQITKNPAAGMESQQEFYENGAAAYMKEQNPDYSSELHYDEEGYFTYYYYKDANGEIELISDETGKLVKVIENDDVKEDAATLARYAAGYNFRG